MERMGSISRRSVTAKSATFLLRVVIASSRKGNDILPISRKTLETGPVAMFPFSSMTSRRRGAAREPSRGMIAETVRLVSAEGSKSARVSSGTAGSPILMSTDSMTSRSSSRCIGISLMRYGTTGSPILMRAFSDSARVPGFSSYNPLMRGSIDASPRSMKTFSAIDDVTGFESFSAS